MACAAPARFQWAALAACCLLGCLGPAPGHAQPAVRTVKDLEAAIYTDMPLDQGGDACIRLLTASGTVGCSAPAGRPRLEGRLMRLEAVLPAAADYPDGMVYLLSPDLLADFLLQCHADAQLMTKVRGVLVEPQPPPGYSQAAQAPLAEFALYAYRYRMWNPTGTGISDLAFPFPIFLLDAATAQNALERAAYNNGQGSGSALHHAAMQLGMDGSGNSSACIQQQSCLPVGGHSVLAALPPLPQPPPPGSPSSGGGSGEGAAAGDGLPAVWVLSQFDSASLFHEAIVGADSPVSGLIAMLAAAELLGGFARHTSSTGSTTAGAQQQQYPLQYRRRLVFAALAGEPWGLMGSKRLLWELHAGNSSMAGFSTAPGSIAGVLEVTQVGRARQRGGSVQLYAHYPTSSSGSPQPPAALLAALQAAAGSVTEGPDGVDVAVADAAAAEPGGDLPPTASAGSFVRVGGGGGGGGADAVPAVLLSGFDTAFQGATFQSQYDTLDTVDADSIATAAVVLARAAHEMALDSSGRDRGAAAQLSVDYAAVKGTVEALMQCLLNSTVGLNCPLAAGLMSPVSGGHVAHYIGILRTITADPQSPDPNVKSDYERFIWNFLAHALAPVTNSSSSGGGSGGGDLQRCQPMNATGCPAGLVCAGSRSIKGPDGLGFCLNATVRYVPAYSTALTCDGCNGSSTMYDYRWKLSDAAADWEQRHGWPADPLWTESNWPTGTPALRLFLKEPPGVETALLVSGLLVSAASVAATLGVRLAYHRKLKRQ